MLRMLLRFIPILLFAFSSQLLFAQTPKSIVLLNTPNSGERAACNNLAGSATQTLAASSQSNDKKYLCKNDVLNIKSTGTIDLSSDPVPSSPAGVGYLFLTCNPTKTGITIQDIAADPCLLKTPTGGIPTGGFYVNTDNNTKGNATFTNDGYVQTTWNAGKPYKLVFAPITFDKLNTFGEAVYEGTPAGACVNVNTAAAFEVIYLNEINSAVVSQGDKLGSFKLTGGLSEYDNGATNYTITINLKSNPAIQGTVTSGNAKHNSTVVFTAPQNGVYTINIEDGKSCGKTFEMILSSAFDIDVAADTVSCTGGTDGSFTVVPVGSAGPYTFQWKISGGSYSASQALPLSGATISGLAYGTYTILATDGSGTNVQKDVNVVQATGLLNVTTSKTDPKCIDSNDGSITANVKDGFAPYYFEWSTSEKGFGKNTITNLGIDPAGTNTYSVTVTDKAGCKKISTISLGVNTIQLQKVVKDASCSGLADGSITVTASGGTTATGKYNFQWSYNNLSQVATASTITNLKDGTYYLTVVDDNGCKAIDSIIVAPGKVLSGTITVVNNKCFGEKTGKITISGTTTGGPSSTPYIFSFNPGSAGVYNNTAATSSYEQLVQGKYNVTMTDQVGCSVAFPEIELKDPSKLDLTTVTAKDPTCAGLGKDGAIEIKAAGGTLAAGNNYKYKWTNNAITPKISNLTANTFTVTVTDDNSCTAIQNFTLTAPAAPTITDFTVKNVDCPNSTNGSIEVKATPANVGDILTYLWSNNETTSSIFNLAPNTYIVTVTDQKGCFVVGNSAVTAPAAMTLLDTLITLPTCTNSADGKVSFSVAGGTKPYTFSWYVNGSLKSTDQDTVLTGLPGTTYLVSITDSKGCAMVTSPLSVNIPKPIETKVSFSGLSQISCVNSGTCDGKATCTVVKEQNPNAVYTFTWSINEVGVGKANTQTTLCAGYNYVTVTDGQCPIKDSVYIDAPEKVELDTVQTEINNVLCFDQTNGSVLAVGKGGVPPYSYEWSLNNQKTALISNLSAGDYILTITDAKNCVVSKTITITKPDTLKAKETLKNPTCFGYKDGSITLNVSGGIPNNNPSNPYTFAWSGNVSTTSKADNLPADTYTIIITDANGCQITKPVQLTEDPPVVFTLDTIVEPKCAGYLTDVKIKNASGGSGSQLSNYTFSIDDGGEASASGGTIPAYAGQHIVRVFDPNGCYSEASVNITEPKAIKVYLGSDVELELGKDYEINAAIEISGTQIAKYTWSPLSKLTFTADCKDKCAQVIRPLEDGSYILVVEDSIGCMGADTINITIDRNRSVFIPNVFSPNVDGTNDFLEVFTPQEAKAVESINYLRIYDRWGNEVFSSPSFKPEDSRLAGNRWDGYYKDVKANEGVYTYLCEVKFIDGVVLKFRGDTALIR